METREEAEFDWFGPEAATFGDRVAGARENAGMSQIELSRRLGVKLVTLQSWEEDRSEPRANKLQMLAGMLNISLLWVLSGQGFGPDEPGIDPVPDDISSILLEIRSIKNSMIHTSDRLGQLEKKLRLAVK